MVSSFISLFTVPFKDESSFSHPPVTTYQKDFLNCGSLSLPKSDKNSLLSFIINDVPTIIVVAGDAKINNQKFKAKFKTKAKMIASSDVENLIGHPIGGVCPFGIKDNVKVYLDESMKRFETMLPACGTPNSAIELTLEELEKASNYIEWIDVCKI